MSPIIARDNQKEYVQAPEGLSQAVCVDVVDLGLEETKWGAKQKVRLAWQTNETYQDEKTKKERRFVVIAKYTLSLNEKATLRHHLEAWRGKKFTKEELDGFDLEKLIGANCQLQIIHNIADNGKTYANIQAIVPIHPTMLKLQPLDYVRVKDRQTGEEQPENVLEDDDLPF